MRRAGASVEHGAMAEADISPHRHRRRRRRRPRGVPGPALVPRRSRAAASTCCAASDRFEYRPLAVLEPFDGAPAWSMELERFAADQDVRLVRDALAAVEPDRHVAITAYSGRLSYDALLVCVGARPVRALPGAITFRGGRDAAAVRAALDAVQPGDRGHDRLRRAVRRLLDAAALRAGDPRRRAPARAAGREAQVVMTSPEAAPLEAFGADASAAVAQLLDARGIEFVESRARDRGRRRRARARRRPADPSAGGRDHPPRPGRPARPRPPAGRPRASSPSTTTGACRAPTASTPRATSPPSRSSRAAWPRSRPMPPPRPCSPRSACPSCRARSSRSSRASSTPIASRPTSARRRWPAARSEPRAYSMWWPPSKIAGRHLAPYLATRAGAPRAPEVRPERDAIAVSIDVPRAVHAVSNALDPSARAARADPSAPRIAVRGSYGWRARRTALASTTCPRSSSPAAGSPASKR